MSVARREGRTDGRTAKFSRCWGKRRNCGRAKGAQSGIGLRRGHIHPIGRAEVTAKKSEREVYFFRKVSLIIPRSTVLLQCLPLISSSFGPIASIPYANDRDRDRHSGARTGMSCRATRLKYPTDLRQFALVAVRSHPFFGNLLISPVIDNGLNGSRDAGFWCD